MHRTRQDEELGLSLAEIFGETILPPHQQLLTVPQTCRAFQICRRTLHKWTEEDQILASVKIGHAKRYRLSDVLALIEQFRRRAQRKAGSQISAFEKLMKSRRTKEISKAA
jgi:DNA-binding transcriptional MerR regulator